MVSPASQSTGPRILGRYAIYDAIAAGGMATVHYGRLLGPVGFSRTVAIKRLHPQFAQDPEFVTMFLDEARLAGRVRHPNVVATLDVVASANEIFLVMDYVHGESLARIIKEVAARDQVVPLNIALRIASDVLQGLHAAHEARDERGIPLNIVHRDISPQNILLGVDGIARLVDFGVAKAAGQGQTTREGQVKGKLGYMAPEQLRGNKVTRQTDVHAFATVFWEMLTGRRLFAGDTEADTIARVVKHDVPPPSKLVPSLPPEVDAVVRRGLAEELEDRFATARDMCVALDACGSIASSMQVGDWVNMQAHDLLERRAQAVSTIERDQDSGPMDSKGSMLAAPEVGGSSKDAKEWVSRLSSSPDLAAVTSARDTTRGGTANPDGSVSVILTMPPTKQPPWGRITGIGVGVLVLVAGVFMLSTRDGRHEPVAHAATPGDVASAASAVPSLGQIPPVPPPTAVQAANSAAPAASEAPSSASAQVAPPPPHVDHPPTAVAKPPVYRPPSQSAASAPATKPSPKHDNVFDSRE